MLNSLMKRPLVLALFKNSAWILADKGLRVTVGLFVTAQMAQVLGPTSFGTIHYALSIATLFAMFSSLGLESIINRDISRHPEQIGRILGTALGLRAIGSLTGLSLVSAIFWFGEAAQAIPVTIAIMSYIFMPLDVAEVFFHNKLQSSIVVIVRSFLFLLASGLRLAFLTWNLGVDAFLWLAVLEVGLGSLLIFAYFKWNETNLSLSFERSRARDLAIQAAPLILFGGASSILIRADSFFIERTLTTTSLGIYSVAVKLTEVFYIVPSALVGSSLPALTRAWISDPKLFARRTQELFFFLSIFSFSLVFLLYVTGDFIIDLLFGAAYGESKTILTIYAFALPLVFSGSVRNQVWLTQGKLKTLAASVAGSSLIFVGIYFYAEPQNLTSYAYIFLASNIVTHLISSFIDPKLFKLQILGFFYKPQHVREHSDPS